MTTIAKEKDEAMNTLALLIAVGAWFLECFVMTLLWRWYGVERFHLPPLTITSAMGLNMFFGLLTYQYRDTSSDDKLTRSLEHLAVVLIALFVGWVAAK